MNRTVRLQEIVNQKVRLCRHVEQLSFLFFVQIHQHTLHFVDEPLLGCPVAMPEPMVDRWVNRGTSLVVRRLAS